MSIVGVFPLTLERGADFQLPPFVYYDVWTGDPATSHLFNFTGMTADCMFRVNPNDTGVILTIAPALGGAAGTYTLPLITVANIETLFGANGGSPIWWDCRFTNAGSPVRFVDHSQVFFKPGVTR